MTAVDRPDNGQDEGRWQATYEWGGDLVTAELELANRAEQEVIGSRWRLTIDDAGLSTSILLDQAQALDLAAAIASRPVADGQRREQVARWVYERDLRREGVAGLPGTEWERETIRRDSRLREADELLAVLDGSP